MTVLGANPAFLGTGYPITLTVAVTTNNTTGSGTVVFIMDGVQAAQGKATTTPVLPASVHAVIVADAGVGVAWRAALRQSRLRCRKL